MRKNAVYLIAVIMIILILFFIIGHRKKEVYTTQEINESTETISGEIATKEELLGTWKQQSSSTGYITFNDDGTGKLKSQDDEEYTFEYNVSSKAIDGFNTKYVTIKINEIDKSDTIRYNVSGDLIFLDTEDTMYFNNMRKDKE